jgi:AraC family transcriptional regulator, regulatory protein of adaptative response / methylated-DNA-[protein]-cysteine methyltransferase
MIITSKIDTPLGILIAGAVEDGICLLEFEDRKMLKAEYRFLEKYLQTTVEEGSSKHFRILVSQLNEYFSGKRKEFSVPLVTPGTDFQQIVWQELLKIPYGTTRTYLEQAEALGNPLSTRAVANANGMNRIAIIIPCHRVIGTDGSLTGYGGGLTRKKWLLDHERRYSGKAVDQSLF